MPLSDLQDPGQVLRELVRKNHGRLPGRCPLCDAPTKIVAEGLACCDACDAFFDYEVKTVG